MNKLKVRTAEKYCPICKKTTTMEYGPSWSLGHLKWYPFDTKTCGPGWACNDLNTGCYRAFTETELDDAFCAFIKRAAPLGETTNTVTVILEEPKGPTLLTLPIDSEARKGFPLFRGCLRYFSAALAGVSRISKLGNDKHNPGEDMHHARGKSMDHGDCILRHLMDVADLLACKERDNAEGKDVTVTNEQVLTEASQLCWRALAFSQELHERLGAAPLAPGARITGPKT